uniref:RRM domain-containing protein n=1 Tax=Zea mays TaxID=4577 RepID=A0A804M9K1_MAIZE
MSETGHTVQVTNLSSRVSESDLHEFFSFSGPIEHIELIRSEGYGATAYVTFKERFALETAVLLSGATIVDQPVCITYWGQPEGTFNFWDRPTWEVEEEIEYRNYQTCQYNTTPQEAFTVAQDIMKTMLEKGVNAGVGAMRSVDETYRVRETTKTVATATGRTAAKVVNGIVTSSYFSAGAMILSDALTRAAKAAADLAAHGRQN